MLDTIFQTEIYPELYKDLYHKIRINYYPPRGDAKEGWDNIDIFGWLGYPMQIKVNFLCRDSILARSHYESCLVDLEELLDYLKDRIGKFKMPKYLEVVDELPRTPASGKIQKFVLKKKFSQVD